ncbi:ATP-sensitive inward rectifier potassium channel 1-like [Pygocentrus nattereri]|uniref:Potassium inwardly rectifying channel subfamily J member 1a, tandem duplicate 6 n=1 Tax=Pygocentrus nattereri TaxID=42514 RepID=A0A3B4C634_PYGNA|nr:ATP-sensitive inward rectifier potassium channel 1-like [Pygocentrus nattereri]XP_017564564.1 ATP-sensitive inward rectifier potassium channel 1-like [Pygocentrus nattereri]
MKFLRKYLAERRIQKNRLVTKDGHCNIAYVSVRYSKLFISVLDFWTTLMEMRWRYVTLHLSASFVFSWFIFGLLWYWVAIANGDLTWQNPPANQSYCVVNMFDMTGAFLQSIETQMSIGYGFRLITPYCPSAITVFTVQCVFGTIIICFWCAVVMTKVARPKKRAKTISFSEKAVICAKQGVLCLQIRVANLRKSLTIGSQIYGKLLRTTVTPEGESIIMDQISIEFMVDSGKDNLFFVCPLTLYHVIDETSPFFHMTVDNLQHQEFELVVFLDGTAESTSSSYQVRTSYIPREIMWGYQFLPIISRNKDGKYCVDFSNFSKVVHVDTAPCAYYYHGESNVHDTSASTDDEGFQEMEKTDQSGASNM